jgi:hypothetical protein
MRNYENNEFMKEVAILIIQGKRYSYQIYQSIGYSGTRKEFNSALSMLKRRGYIKFADDAKSLPKNPFQRKRQYDITQKTVKLLQSNPNEHHKEVKEGMEHRFSEYISNHPGYLEKLAKEFAQQNPEKIIHEVFKEQPAKVIEVLTDYEDVIKDYKLEDKRKYNNALLEIQRLQQELNNQPVKAQTDGKPLSPRKLAKEEQRKQLAIHRQKLSQHYYGNRMLLDAQFFQQWQNVVPVKVKGVKWFTKNSVEFISKSNKEFARGHAVEMNPEQMYDSQFHIIDISRDGITIGGRGVAEGGEKIKF